MLIEDGATGSKAKVDNKNRLHVHAQDDDRTEIVESGKAWSLSFETITTTDAGDYFIYMSNTGAETYIVTDMFFTVSAATTLDVQKVTGTAVFSAAVAMTTPSLNLGSAVLPSGVWTADVNTTGLTSGGTLFHLEGVAAQPNQVTFHGGIVMPPGTAMAILSRADVAISGTINMFVIDTVTN